MLIGLKVAFDLPFEGGTMLILSDPEEPIMFRGTREKLHVLPSYSAVVDTTKFQAANYGTIKVGSISVLSTESSPCKGYGDATTFHK